MSLFQVACPGGDDLFLAVQRYIEDELDIDHLGSGQHILMDGVVLQHAGVGIRAGNGLVAVVFVDGLLGADARQDALAAAGEAGEEVWLNKALSHQQVTFSGQLVDVEVCTGGQHAHVDELIRVKCVVDGDFLMIHDGIAKHAALLFLGGGAVQAGGNQDGDIGVRVALADLIQQDGQGDLAGDGAGVVTGDQHNFLFTLGQVTQARGGNGMLQCLMNQFYFRFAGLVFVHFCGDNSFQVGFVNMQVQGGSIVRNRDGFHTNASLVVGALCFESQILIVYIIRLIL